MSPSGRVGHARLTPATDATDRHWHALGIRPTRCIPFVNFCAQPAFAARKLTHNHMLRTQTVGMMYQYSMSNYYVVLSNNRTELEYSTVSWEVDQRLYRS